MTSLAPTKARILVLDDSALVCTALTITLENAGYPVATASTMAELEALWREFEPEVVLTDVNMPELSGGDVCQALKQRLAGRLVPIVLMSALPEAELEAVARRCGAEGYVCKAGGPRAIVHALEALLDDIVF